VKGGERCEVKQEGRGKEGVDADRSAGEFGPARAAQLRRDGAEGSGDHGRVKRRGRFRALRLALRKCRHVTAFLACRGDRFFFFRKIWAWNTRSGHLVFPSPEWMGEESLLSDQAASTSSTSILTLRPAAIAMFNRVSMVKRSILPRIRSDTRG